MNQCHFHLNLSDEISRTYFQTKHLLRNTENTENIKQTQILLLLYKIRHNSCKSWLLMKVIIIKNDTLSSLFSQPFTQITHHLVHSASFMLSVLFNSFHFSTTSSSSSPLLSLTLRQEWCVEATLSSSHFRHGWVIEGHAWSPFDFPAAQ